jgi:hypothetical protein
MGLYGLLRVSFTFVYVDDVHTSQETHLWASTCCYGNSFAFLYVDVRTTQETQLWASTGCYGDKFTSTLPVIGNTTVIDIILLRVAYAKI